jgi:sterol 3beta-glucosyltransferase
MRTTIVAIGSRGDVQPFVALGRGLQAAGHDVAIATHPPFEELVRSSGLEFRSVGGDPRQAMDNDDVRAALHSDSAMRSWRHFARLLRPVLPQTGNECWSACQGAEMIVCSPMGMLLGPSIAEKLGAVAVATHLQPSLPTSEFPSFFSRTNRELSRIHNRLTWLQAGLMVWLPLRSTIERWRTEQLGLPRRSPDRSRQWKGLALNGYSPSVVPRPADWGDNVVVTGYWFLDAAAEWSPPADLVDFLAAGPPPVYVGFGSMTPRNTEAMAELAVDALARAGQRGILAAGWGGLRSRGLPDSVFQIEAIPHDWLFPRMAAAVHHGGAGTTGASLRPASPRSSSPSSPISPRGDGGWPAWAPGPLPSQSRS